MAMETSSEPLISAGAAPEAARLGAGPPDANRSGTADFQSTKERAAGDAGAVFDPEPIPAMAAAAETAVASTDSVRILSRPGTLQEEGIDQLGDYRLIKKLGQGGMGEVFLAHQLSLDRDVALKVLTRRTASNPVLAERFVREARTMAKLDHPNIVRGYAVGEDRGLQYVAMEFIDGQSMQEWLDQLGRLSVGDALHVTIRVADALHHAHEAGLIHRDIKPANMLVTTRGVVKVADLGLAKSLDDDKSMTQSGLGLGTPYYMPPEQAHDAKSVDQRSDIYALGSSLYHFLTGQYPFEAESVLELILAKERGLSKHVRKLNPDVPERLELMVDKMMAKDQKYRYQTCAELIRDLESLNLANPTLSFLTSAGFTAAASLATSRPLATSLAGSQTFTKTRSDAPILPAPVPLAAPPPAVSSVPARPREARPSGPPPDRQFWYVKYRDVKRRKLVIARLNTPRVLQLIAGDHFDLEAKICKSKDGLYCPVAAIPEFESAMRARLLRARADRKGRGLQTVFDEIDKDLSRRRKRNGLSRLLAGTGPLVRLVISMALLAGIGYGGIHLFKWIAPQLLN